MLKQKSWIALLAIFIVALIASGCARYTGVTETHPLENRSALISRLEALGIHVIKLGDHLRIIISTDDFFDVDNGKLQVAKEPTLHGVAKLVSLYDDVPVFVEGHSDNMGSTAENIRRTTRQAADVAAVLWAYGVDQRRIHVEGYGSRFPIADNRTVKGRAFNRRIEIRF